MPSWSSRQNSSPSTSSSNAAPSSFSTPSHHGTKRNVSSPFDYTLPPLYSTTPTAPGRRAHSRSISHPFPSIRSGANKKGEVPISKRDFLESDDDDDDGDDEDGVTYISDPRSKSPRKHPPGWTPAEEFVAGKCMTCDSTVRWPRLLKVYRCTVCLTVNDLEPCPDSQDHGPAPKIRRKAVPLSVERTRSIIDQCLSAYLQDQLKECDLVSSSPRILPPEPLIDSSGMKDIDPFVSDGTEGLISAPAAGLQLSFSQMSIASQRKREDRGFPPMTSLDTEWRDSHGRNRSSSDTPVMPRVDHSPHDVSGRSSYGAENRHRTEGHRSIFRPLEEYLLSSFTSCDCLNDSFMTARSPHRAASDDNPPRTNSDQLSVQSSLLASPVVEPDAKTLLLGDIAENSSWWMGGRPPRDTGETQMREKDKGSGSLKSHVSSRSPRIDWTELEEWYRLIISLGDSWIDKWLSMKSDDADGEESSTGKRWDSIDLSILEKEITEARIHAQRTLLKATENLLKRPRRPLKRPEDIRFLLILLANPLLYSASNRKQRSMADFKTPRERDRSRSKGRHPTRDNSVSSSTRRGASAPPRQKPKGPSYHSGIVKRMLGLLSNLPNECHCFLVGWFSRFSEGQFERIVDLIGSFVTYRLTRQHGRQRIETPKPTNGLVPSLSGASRTITAQLHAALSERSPPKSSNDGRKPVIYSEDWQIRAAARVMSLLFAANNANFSRKRDYFLLNQRAPNSGMAAKSYAYSPGQMISTSSFYNTLLDYADLVADFETWESRSSKFSFCQYPFFLSIYAKIHILEYDARRQMESKAREAFFDSILSRKAVSQFLVLKVRRECLVEDSLRSVSEVVGSVQEEVKKGLRIEFVGEEGVDAGGLRKEWFLLLVREVFDPNHGLFIYDDDSHFCYFNPFCFESSEQFFLVGVVLGLAIYNSTILDVAFPPFAFKKLLASAPTTGVPATSTSRVMYSCTLDDLAEYRPALAKGLRALLEFEGDVQETFCYDFVAQIDRYGQPAAVPLCPGGEKRPVTNANRREFVDLYVQYLLDTAVHKQYEPFKRGFFTVCGGNALYLFRPEEIELLVRGSDEHLDVASLRAVATYENWSTPNAESEPVVRWFWEFFTDASPQNQRKLLSFITGSDRIPAMGATSLIIRVSCLGNDSLRYPIARTCFNTLGLFRYSTREQLETKLWGAVVNSEGFGLK